MVRFGSLLAVALSAVAAPAPRPGGIAAPAARPSGFKVVRDFALHFDHRLGAAEAKRRVMARLATLQKRFAAQASSDTVWHGDEAEMRVAAFTQTANAHIAVGDRAVDVRVHLPLLISPLGGNIEDFLDRTGAETLR